ANARQIMYAARPYVQQKVGKPLHSAYFTQTLLPNYIEEHGCHHWTTAYDARGHFAEPHGGQRFGVGTLEVRDYLRGVRDPSFIDAALSAASIKCYGPKHNFGGLLFIEKEGFGSYRALGRTGQKDRRMRLLQRMRKHFVGAVDLKTKM